MRRTSFTINAGIYAGLLAAAAAASAGAFDSYSYWDVPLVGAAGSAAVADDARSVAVNPAGLAAGHGFNGYVATYVQHGLGSKHLSCYFDTLLGGVGYDWLRRSEEERLGLRVSRFSYTFGFPAWRWFGVGAGVARLAASQPYLTSAWTTDVGVLVRPLPYVSFGAVARNLNEPAFLRQRERRTYVAGLGVRPGWERLTLAGDAAWEEGEPTDAVGWRAGADVEFLRGCMLSLSVDDERRYEAGVSFGFPYAGFGYDAKLNEDGDVVADDAHVSFQLEPRPSAIPMNDGYAELDLTGDLAEVGGGFSLLGGPGRDGARDFLARLERCRRDNNIKGVIIRFGDVNAGFGPGVDALAQDIRQEIKKCRAAGKRVYAYVAEVTRPETYYIAAAADEVVISPWGYFGGVGTYINLWRITGLAERFGVTFDYATAGAYKGSFHQIGPEPTPEQREEIQNIVDDAYGQFIRDVAADRGMTAEDLRDCCEGAPLTAEACKAAGLADEVYTYEELKSSIARGEKKDELATTRPGTGKMWNERWGSPKRVRVILAVGGIARGESGSSFLTGARTMGSDTVVAQLRAAGEDPSVGAVVLRVDSGGGDGLASDEIYRAVKGCRDQGKVVVASMGDVAASGGYYIALGAERIFAEPATLTGSIGVVTAKPVLAGLYEKYGISRTGIRSHEHADATSINRAWTDEERAWVDEILRSDYGRFMDTVAADRRLERSKVEEIAQGRVYTGARAKDLGLVDELGSLDDAVAYARGKAALPADAPVEYVGGRGAWWLRVPGAAAQLLGTGY